MYTNTFLHDLRRGATALLLLSCVFAALAQGAEPNAQAAGEGVFVPTVDKKDNKDLNNDLIPAEDVKRGLFPDDGETADEKAAREYCKSAPPNFKCAPPGHTYMTFSLRGANFAVGSAELSDLLKRQLRSFAEVFKGRQSSAPMIHIDGHADVSGNEEGNKRLSQRRAESVKAFLVSLGVTEGLFAVAGHGSKSLRNPEAPTAPENRRVEIARILQK